MSYHRKKDMRISLMCFLAISLSAKIFANGAVVNTVETLVQRTVALPCVATQHPVGDTPNLLLFYRQSSNIPFFSYDARTGDFWRQGNSKTRDRRYEGRVYLNLTQPRKVHLNLERVTIQDAGDFTCRVDFVSSPSLTSIVKLKVFANPTMGPTIRIGTGPLGGTVNGGEVGPFHEGQMLNLSCTVTGGFPAPSVTWWQDVKLLDNSSYIISSSSSSSGGPPKIVNDLTVGPLTRSLVQTPFTCRSENNPLSSPIDKTIFVKIHNDDQVTKGLPLHKESCQKINVTNLCTLEVAPQSVILPEAATVRAGRQEMLECRAKGAYPEANITWYLNGITLNFTSKETRQMGSDTVSWVHFTASPKDNKATLTCTGSSPTLPDPPVSTNVTLNVTHAPQVRLELGSSLKPNRIRQGDDVYFECHTEANPPVQRIAWYKEENEVRHNQLSGVIVGGTNLVLQGVQRPDAGKYTCRATNSVATVSSDPLTLSIQYGPMCAQGRVTVTAVEGEVVTLLCKVDAYPSNVTFYWLFNNTVDSTKFRKSEYTTEGLESNLRYVAYSARDYGTVFCWASNVVGRQEDPCAFTLQPAGAPDSVHDCVLTNQSAGSLHITCKPGADGGLTQTFRAAVYAADVNEPVRVLEGMSPVFTVEGLAPGEDYMVTLTAINRRGASPPVSLEAFTLKVAENRMISGVSSSQPEPEEGPSGAVSPLLGVFLGIVGAFLLLAAAAIFITKRHCSRGPIRTLDLVAGQELEVKGATSESRNVGGDGSTKTQDTVETPDLTESDPFLVTSECSSGTVSTPASAGGGVFTIPTHIPPPPQYCSSSCNDLSPTQHALHHTPAVSSQEQPMQTAPKPIMVSQCDLLHQGAPIGSDLSLQTSSPEQYRLQRSTSVERCATRAVMAQTYVGHPPPTQWAMQHGTPVTFAISHPGHAASAQLGIIYSGTGEESIQMQHPQQPDTINGCGVMAMDMGSAHPGAIHYVQPHPGVEAIIGGNHGGVVTGPPSVTTTSVHYSGALPPQPSMGLVSSNLCGVVGSVGAPRTQVMGFVAEQGMEHPAESQMVHPSPKSKTQHVTWAGGLTHGEESAV